MRDEDGKTLRFPKSVFFIISNEFCERFAYYGIRTILSLYFTRKLLYSEDQATVLYHCFSMLAYFSPLLGAVIADSWLGKFRTILYVSCLYVLGQLLLSGSAVPWFDVTSREQLTFLGLFFIAMGTGGIKPCVSAFGGDQFKLPQQEVYLSTFFSMFYLAINCGSLTSTALTPILREDVKCFGEKNCFSLAFLVPAILMIIAIVVFFAGKSMYKIKQPEGNVVVEVAKCICHAISRKSKVHDTREHWLDYADDRYDRRMIEDTKSVLKVLKLFIPLPIFWALFDQQGSRWTFQATRMDGETFGYLLKPDQFQIVNPLFIIIFIPIFQYIVYPIIEKLLFINTPLRKLTAGGLLTAMAFVISGMVEIKLENTYVKQPEPLFTQVRIFNTIPCQAELYIDNKTTILDGLHVYENLKFPVREANENGYVSIPFTATYKDCRVPGLQGRTIDGPLHAKEETSGLWYLSPEGLSGARTEIVEKSSSGAPLVRAIIYRKNKENNLTVNFRGKDRFEIKMPAGSEGFSNYTEVEHDSYKIDVDGAEVKLADSLQYRMGGVYAIVGFIDDGIQEFRSVTLVQPNSMHMLWLLPQYIVITAGEIMFSITGLEFAFTQAPTSMKSLLTAAWLFTVAIGNLVVVIIAEAHFFKRQVFEFFLFAGLMFIDMIIFAVMAMFYKYVEVSTSNENSSSDNIDMQTNKGLSNSSYSEDF